MHFVITITSLSYDGGNYLSYTANGVRNDHTSNVSTYSSSIQVGQTSGAMPTPFEFCSNEFIYKLLADDMYANHCAQFSLSPTDPITDPTTFVFLGLSIVGPFVYTAPAPEFVQVSPNK